MKIRPLFAWYDFWVGAYWNQEQRKLFILPLPMLGIVIEFGSKSKNLIDMSYSSMSTEEE